VRRIVVILESLFQRLLLCVVSVGVEDCRQYGLYLVVEMALIALSYALSCNSGLYAKSSQFAPPCRTNFHRFKMIPVEATAGHSQAIFGRRIARILGGHLIPR
jgi:hypothetical protein